LMMVLQPMTALVRERSEELVEVIKKAVEEGEGETGTGGRAGGGDVVMKVVEEETNASQGKKATEIVAGVWDMLSSEQTLSILSCSFAPRF